MEKRNVVNDDLTPCTKCQGAHSEHKCPACKTKSTEKQASDDSRLNPESIAEAHK